MSRRRNSSVGRKAEAIRTRMLGGFRVSVGERSIDEGAWRLLFARAVDAERLVFVDKMGANVSLLPLYAWSRRGLRAHAKAPRNWGKNVTLLASITGEGVGPCLVVEGPTTREVFETHLERVLAPALRPGQAVVLWTTSRSTKVAG